MANTSNKPVPPVIDTAKLLNVTPDPRGDNRPGVLTDQPGEEGINPVTNLPEEQTADDGVTARIPDQSQGPTNPPKTGEPKTSAPTGRKVEMVAERDYWRRPLDGEDPNADYRIRAGETFSIPQSEAEDLMEQGIAKRAKRS